MSVARAAPHPSTAVERAEEDIFPIPVPNKKKKKRGSLPTLPQRRPVRGLLAAISRSWASLQAWDGAAGPPAPRAAGGAPARFCAGRIGLLHARQPSCGLPRVPSSNAVASTLEPTARAGRGEYGVVAAYQVTAPLGPLRRGAGGGAGAPTQVSRRWREDCVRPLLAPLSRRPVARFTAAFLVSCPPLRYGRIAEYRPPRHRCPRSQQSQAGRPRWQAVDGHGSWFAESSIRWPDSRGVAARSWLSLARISRGAGFRPVQPRPPHPRQWESWPARRLTALGHGIDPSSTRRPHAEFP